MSARAKGAPAKRAESGPTSNWLHRPLSPMQTKFYFECLESVVAVYFGQKALHHLASFCRSRARVTSRLPNMRVTTLAPVIGRMLAEKARLYPNNQQAPAGVAKGGPR